MNPCTKAVLVAMVITSFTLTNIIPKLVSDNAALADKAMQQASQAQKRAEDAEISLKKQQAALDQRLKAGCR